MHNEPARTAALAMTIQAASDESVINNSDTFGWVIARAQGDSIVQWLGIVCSHQLASLRVEAYALS